MPENAQINSEVATESAASNTIEADSSVNTPAPLILNKMTGTSGSSDLLCTNQQQRAMTCLTKLES